MSKVEAEVLPFPIKTKLVCSACGAPGEGSCHCGVAYVTPGERAEAAVKASPEKSDRAIAEDIGVSPKTVSKARRNSTVESSTVEKRKTTVNDFTVEKRKSTGASAPVEKRIGKDGKARKQPKPPGPRKPAKLRDNSEARYAAMYAEWKTGETTEKLAKTYDCKIERVHQILDAEEKKREQIELSQTATQKLEMAKRAIERKLNAEHAARMAQIEEEVRVRVVAEGKEYLDMVKGLEKEARETVALYQKWTNNLKPIFTEIEFNTILKSLDSSAIAFRLNPPDNELIKRMDTAMALVRDRRDRLLLIKSK